LSRSGPIQTDHHVGDHQPLQGCVSHVVFPSWSGNTLLPDGEGTTLI
jgi:hypothetical protein